MPGAAAWPLPCAGWFRASPAVSSGTSDRTASSKRFRQRATWARSRRIIFHLAARLKPRAMHAKPRQDGTARAVLWLEPIKTRCTGGPVAEGVMTQRTKPPFRADHVGSILRTAPVKDARAKREKGEITAAQLKEVEDREIETIIKKQEEIGLKLATDGEFRRSWWHFDFYGMLDNVEIYELDHGIQFRGVQTKAQSLRIVGKVGFSNHPMLEHFKFLKAHTKVTPKMTIPAPPVLHFRLAKDGIRKDVYPDLDGFFHDLGQAYKQAVKGFYDAGCR